MKKIRSGKNNPNYKDGRTLRKHYCIDCGKELSNYTAKRCKSCAAKERLKNPENNSAYKDGRTLKKNYCMDCGKKISYVSKRCKSCANKERIKNPKFRENYIKKLKQAWLDGKYDGVFMSPTRPEKAIMKILNDLRIYFIFQYRPKKYSKVYDFYIPKLNLLIEYDSIYWHNRPGAKEKDAEKTQWTIDNGYNLLRLNEYNLYVLEMILKNFINLSIKYKIRKKEVEK